MCIVRIWVKDLRDARSPCSLDEEDMEFVWGTDQKASMEDLKQVIVTAPAFG